MVEKLDVLSDSRDENRLFSDEQKALKRIEELEGEQIKTVRREMVPAVVGTMKAGKSTTISAIVGQEILPNRGCSTASIPALIRHVSGKTKPVLHLEHIQSVCNSLITLQEKLATPVGQQVTRTPWQTRDIRELLDILTDDSQFKNEYHGEEEISTGLTSLNDLVHLVVAMKAEFPFDEYAGVQRLSVIDVEFSHLVGTDACQGTLALPDTPGLNKIGQPQIEVTMWDQLQKVSAVLAVVDYAQMNLKADEDVCKELNVIADVSASHLFVLVNKFDEKDRNGDGIDTVRQKIPVIPNNDVLLISHVYPGPSHQVYLANRTLHKLWENGTLPVDKTWVDDSVKEVFGRMKKDYVCKDNELATGRAADLWECSLIDQLITEVILNSHSRVAALAVNFTAAELTQNAENISEYLSLRHQGLIQSIQSLRVYVTSLLEGIWEVAGCQGQVTADVRVTIGEIGARAWELLIGACASLEEELNGCFRSGKHEEQQTPEEEGSTQSRERNAFAFFHDIFETGNQHNRMQDFDPGSLEIKFSDRREALGLMTQVESTVANLHREAGAQFRPELEEVISGVEIGFHGAALYAIKSIVDHVSARLEDEGFIMKVSFPAVSQLQARLAIKTSLSAFMGERTETITRHHWQNDLWGKICGTFGTSDWDWETYKKDVSRSVININTIREGVMSLARAYFGELQASTEQDINQPVCQGVDAFFYAFRERVEQLRNTLIQNSEDRKRDQQTRKRLTRRLQALSGRVPEFVTDNKALRGELETML